MKTITKKLIDSPFAKGKCYQYGIEIENDGKKARFKYNDSVYNYEKKKELNYDNVLYCLILDARAYSETEDILDFCFQFGYMQDKKRCREAYKGCEENYYKLNSLFTEKELEELEKELEEKW
jgi:hypothetical protein